MIGSTNRGGPGRADGAAGCGGLARSGLADPLFWLFALAALGLRLWLLSGQQLWWDEYLSLHRAFLPLPELLRSLALQTASEGHADLAPPLSHILIHFSLSFGSTTAFVKLPSALLGGLGVGAAYLAGRELFGRGVGVLAGLVLLANPFHLHYSQDARWYAAFHCFFFCALYASARFAARPGLVQGAWLAAWLAALLYTSYVAAPVVAGFFLFFGGHALWLRLVRGEPAQARRAALAAAGLALAVGLVYLPQVPAHLVATRTFFERVDPRFSFEALVHVLGYLAGVGQDHAGLAVLILAGLGLAGAALALARGRGAGLALLLAATVPQTVAAYVFNLNTAVLARYLVGLYFLELFLAALGACALGSALRAALERALAGSVVRGLALAGPVLAAALVLWPGAAALQDRHPPQKTASNVAEYLLFQKRDVDWLLFARNKQLKLVTRWHTGEAYASFEEFDHQGFKRFYYLSGQGEPAPADLVKIRDFRLPEETLGLRAGGVVSVAPVPLTAGAAAGTLFAEDFASLGYYRTVWRSHRVGVDFTRRVLALDSHGKPGRALYRFDARRLDPERGLRLAFSATFSRNPRLPGDARLAVLAGPDPDSLRQVAVVDQAAFDGRLTGDARERPRGPVTLAFQADLAEAWSRGADLYLAFDFTPGNYQSEIALGPLRLEDVAGAGEAGTPTRTKAGPDPVWTLLANAAANTRLVPWRADQYQWPPRAIHVFRLFAEDRPEMPAHLPCGSPEDLARFRERHPAARPVLRLDFANGREAFAFYDAPQALEGVPVAYGRPVGVTVEDALPARLGAVTARGALSLPELDLGGATLRLPFAAPWPSQVVYAPGREALLRFQPLFTAEGFTEKSLSPGSDAAKLDGEDCLSCPGANPCRVAFRLGSRLPMKTARVVFYPRGAVRPGAGLEAEYAVNGSGQWRPLARWTPSGQNPWEGEPGGVEREIAFPEPVHVLDVRFTLSGRVMQLWSTPDSPLTVEVRADASADAAPTLGQSPFTLRLDTPDQQPFTLFLDTDPPDTRTFRGR